MLQKKIFLIVFISALFLLMGCGDPHAVIKATLEIVETREISSGTHEIKIQITAKETYGACGAKGVVVVNRWLSQKDSVYEFSHSMGNFGSSEEKEKFFTETIDAKLALEPDIIKIKINKHTCSEPVKFSMPKIN